MLRVRNEWRRWLKVLVGEDLSALILLEGRAPPRPGKAFGGEQ